MNIMPRIRWLPRQSLMVKLISFLGLGILVSGVLLGILLAWTYAHYENRRLVDTLSKELEIVSYAMSAGVEFNDVQTIEEGVLLLRNVREFMHVRVVKMDGNVLLAKDFPRKNKISRVYDFSVTAPIFNAVNVKVGQIEAVATSGYLRANIQRTSWIVLAASFPVVLLAMLLVVLFLRKFLAPLGRLKAAIDRVSKDGFIGRVDVVSNDEVGELARSFNAMSENLRETTVSRDELRSAQARLVQSEKLAAIGQLAAGVAHEINNPAGFVASNLEILETYVAAYLKMLGLSAQLKVAVERRVWDEAVAVALQMHLATDALRMGYIIADSEHLVRQSREGVSRIEKIVADLKVFAYEGAQWFEESVKIENVIEMTLGIAHNEMRYRIDLRKDYGDTPQIRCNVQKMGQVFLNLIVNAAQAIPAEGIITIRTYQEPGYVCIDITDTGCGISDDNLKKIFDPFFTTKPIGKGTGLGLSISYELVKKHGGTIRVRSAEGQGSTFTVALPFVGL